MLEFVGEKFREAVWSIGPVMIIMLIIGVCLGFHSVTMVSILVSTVLFVLGVTMFTIGAELSMMEIGKSVSSNLLKSKRVWLILLVSFVVGIVITVAEPDLKVLASQMTAIDSKVLILSVGLGVGLFLSIAAGRIIYQISLKFSV